MPTQDRVWRDNGGQFQQSLASDGVSLYGKQATLVVVEQQAFLSEFFDPTGIGECEPAGPATDRWRESGSLTEPVRRPQPRSGLLAFPLLHRPRRTV